MKRSEVNRVIQEATAFFAQNGWSLPPQPRWDVTDFGLGHFETHGLVLINLAEEPEYCEKLMYAKKGQTTPAHCHHTKKEDIIVRTGVLAVQVWNGMPDKDAEPTAFTVKINGIARQVASSATIELQAGERITLVPHVYHAFYPLSDACVIGEVSTANDDLYDNFFVNPAIGRFSPIEEDEKPLIRLVSDQG